MTSLEGWDTTNMPTLQCLVRLVGLEPTRLSPSNFKFGEFTNFSTIAKNGRSREIRTPDILLPKQAVYQADLYSDCSCIILYVFSKVNWCAHLDLNQESTNYEFAALTNYAIVPIIHQQILVKVYGVHHHANDPASTVSCTKIRDSQDGNQSIQYFFG